MIRGLALRSAMPDMAAVLRSLLGVGAAALVAVQWGPPGSPTAVAAAAALTGAVALQDSPRGRVQLAVGAATVAGVATLVGTVAAGSSPVFVVVAAAWCLAAAMPWALGANAGLMGAASAALVVVAPPVAPTFSGALATAGLAFAAGLVQAALVAVWPRRRWRVQRDALAGAYRSLAEDARRMADRPGDGTFAVDPEPLLALRAAFTTADVQAKRHSADYRSWYGLPERIAATLAELGGAPSGTPPREVLAAAAAALAAVADADRDHAEAAISRLDEASDSASHPVQRLRRLVHEAVAIRLGEFLPSSPGAVRFGRPELRTSVRSALMLMRGHLDRRSPVFRHAVRLSGAVLLGCGIERFTEIAHGHWVPLTVLMVLRPETAHTYTRCAGRIAGALTGVALASVVLVLLTPGPLLTVLLALIFIGMAYAATGLGYVASAAALAAAVVFLIGLDRAGPAATTDDRLFGVLVGGGLAVLAHVVLPDDALTRLAQRAGELLKTEVDYAAVVLKAYVHEPDSPGDALSAAWQRAFRARAAFEAAAGATRMESRELRRWMGSYRTALNAVTAACTTLEAALPDRPAAAWDGEFVLAVDEYVESLSGDPPTAASPWTVDATALGAADKRLREVLPRRGVHERAARVLVSEVAAITRSVSGIAVIPGPTSAR